MPPGVVADCGADVLGDRVDGAEQVLEGLLVELGVLVERRVQVVDVRLVVLAVVDLHRLRVDIRLERGEIVGQGRQGVCHDLLRGGDGPGHRFLL